MLNSKKELVVVVVALLVLGSLMLVGVSRARITARKISSQNNLKQIGLAIQNFADTYKRLPEGCDDQARHGWMSLIIPYAEASTWYPTLDLDVNWDHPLNHHHFTKLMPVYSVSGHSPQFTQEGFGIAHYHANPALLFRGSVTKPADVTVGLSNVWLAAEINGNYTPFGYPFNWRELRYPLDQRPNGFGCWHDGANFVFMDSSVRFLDNETAASVVEQLATSFPLPEQSLTKRPHRQFRSGQGRESPNETFVKADERPAKGGPPYAVVWLATESQPEFIDFVHGLVDMERVIRSYPQAQILRIPYPRDDQELDLICSLVELETLCLMSELEYAGRPKPLQIPVEQLIVGLQRLPKLQELKLTIDEHDLLLAQDALPNCKVVVTRRAPHIFRH